jgi:hypothetical protein
LALTDPQLEHVKHLVYSINFERRNWQFLLGGLSFLVARSVSARPNVETATCIGQNIPSPPDAFALAEARIPNAVGADVGFGPVTLATGGVEAAGDDKLADIVVPVTDLPVGDWLYEIEPMVTGPWLSRTAKMFAWSPCPAT